jgi:catechol 2,3-dioxygenase-like lactoylglutathione lyase family enzyme
VKVLGLAFAGSSTPHRAEMSRFLAQTLQLAPASVVGVEADLFALPDGSRFAVASPGGMGDTERTVGFLVDDLDKFVAALAAVGTETDPITVNAAERYVHFRAPDGQLYELIERRP